MSRLVITPSLMTTGNIVAFTGFDNIEGRGSRIEDRADGMNFYSRSSILDLLSSLPGYSHVVDACLDEACGTGVRRLNEDSDRLSGELAEVHRGGGKDSVVVLGSAQFLKYGGHRSADYDPHPEEVGG